MSNNRNSFSAGAVATASDSTRRLNPELFGATGGNLALAVTARSLIRDAAPTERRIRQQHGPKRNRLEAEWLRIVSAQYPNYPRPRAHAKRYSIANGCYYTPDVSISIWPDLSEHGGPARETAFEVKGKKAWDDAIVKIKVAAHEWPEVQWILVWKTNAGEWKQQIILP